MDIKNVKTYGISESIEASGYPMSIGNPKDISHYTDYTDTFGFPEKVVKRAEKLGRTDPGTGHNSFLKGCIVQFDIQYPQYLTPQMQRYHWFEIISSQSKMHRLTSRKDITNDCNKWVNPEIIKIVNFYIEKYNESENKTDKDMWFKYIISNLPMGFEMWMRISTNYLQLKTIYKQRKNHKLEEWRFLCEWIKTLPLFKEIVLNKQGDE